MKKFDTLVFIGRLQPFHHGHKAVIDKGLELAEQVIVCLGSADAAPTPRNPFTYEERKSVLEACYAGKNVTVVPAYDYPYDDSKWVANIQRQVSKVAVGNKIGLIGHSKDSSSYYLKIFPTWGSVEVDNVGGIDATKIRESIFTGNASSIYTRVPHTSFVFLQEWVENHSSSYQIMKQEYDMIEAYKRAWAAAPYAPTFVTVDAVVIQSGHVLMVTRKAAPGRGLLALPGGFLDPQEKLENGALRELKEETRIKVPLPVLRGNIKASKTFDHPNRSLRGRTITTAFYIVLPDERELPKVKGSDDAEHAQWIPLGELERSRCFEDHYSIISHFTGIE